VRELTTKEPYQSIHSTAVEEKMAALQTEEYLEEHARRADPAALDRILARVSDVPSLPGDEREPAAGNGQPHKRLQPTKAHKLVSVAVSGAFTPSRLKLSDIRRRYPDVEDEEYGDLQSPVRVSIFR
jgi:hypothetical protein